MGVTASSPLFEIARVLVRLDHIASFIVNANRRIVVNSCKSAKPLKAKRTRDDSPRVTRTHAREGYG